jgi:hypothetical protein
MRGRNKSNKKGEKENENYRRYAARNKQPFTKFC